MKALQAIEGQLDWVDCPAPICGEGEIRIRVAAAGLNRADLLQRKGLYPPPPGVTKTLGLECAGVVVETGSQTHWQVGDKVCALLAGGGMAEEVVVDARHALPLPPSLSMAEAAAVPEVYTTAWLNLFHLGQLQLGEKALIHAGASGVGSAGIQLCKAFNNPCWVSVGSSERLSYCESLGAQGGVIRGEDLDGLRDFAPFNVILDPVGAKYAALNLQLLAMDARWIVIGLMGGREITLDLAKLLARRIQLVGSTLRSKDADSKAALLADLEARVWPLFGEGKLSAQLKQSYLSKDVEVAFEALASNQVAGKVALILDEGLL